MKTNEFKDWLKEDRERVVKILESVECHSIWYASEKEIRACPPNSNNKTSLAVNLKTLNCSCYSANDTFNGDIIALVQHFKDYSFKEAYRYLLALFGISNKSNKKRNFDALATFKQMRKGSNYSDSDIEENKRFGLEILNKYVRLPHINLLYEGILPQTAELFNVCYDGESERILFPHFAYDDVNAIVGITGRTLRSAEDIKNFGIPKYWNFIKGYKKTNNLYGFSHSIEYIKKNGIIVIFEAEKSVQKQFTMTRNKGFSVSTGGHEFNMKQAEIILRHTPVDTEVVFAYDKDIMDMKDKEGELIGEDFLRKQCNMISKYRKTSYIYDKHNILSEKDSPIDEGIKKWNHLLKYRTKL